MKEILGKTWENHDAPATPHLMYAAADASVDYLNKIAGYSYEIITFYIKDKWVRYGIPEQDMVRLGKYLLNNPSEVFKLSRIWKEKIKKFDEVCEKIQNLGKLPYKELLDLYKEFYNSYMGEYAIPLLANSIDFYFQKFTQEEIKDKENFLKIIAPTKESFSQKEINELLSIKKDKNFVNNIKKHAERYFWLQNNYAGSKILGKNYFIKRYENEKPIKLERVDKKPIIKKYNLNPNKIKVVEEAINWRDERKKYNMIGDHYLCLFLEEIGKRKGILLEDIKYTLPDEIEDIDVNAIKERKKPSLFIVLSGKRKVILGKKAVELHNKMYPHLLNPKGELNGLSACLGFAKGEVKIILSEKDFHKMDKGNILVTTMTRPEFVPLMKKACAIITDEGGITCHAAIVSRELKTPCIIGTKSATEILKDGDIVEVNADKGMIRKI